MTGHKDQAVGDGQLVADRIRIANATGRPCAGRTTAELEEWFPAGHVSKTDADRASRAVQAAQAAQLCAGCPVKALCGSVAIRGEEWFGIWGGMSEQDRRPLIKAHRRTRRRQPTAAEAA